MIVQMFVFMCSMTLILKICILFKNKTTVCPPGLHTLLLNYKHMHQASKSNSILPLIWNNSILLFSAEKYWKKCSHKAAKLYAKNLAINKPIFKIKIEP